jgi:5'(3')-deoxyribonucleotidase
MNRPVLAIDIDDTLSFFWESWMNQFQILKGYKPNKEDCIEWDITKYIKPEDKDFVYSIISDKLHSNIIFKSCTPHENSSEVTEWLQNYFDIWLVTATHYNNFPSKVEWVKRYYPHIDPHKICVLSDKSLFKADWIIDDKYSTVCQFKHGVLFHQPWNSKYEHNPRVHNWLEIKQYFQRLINLGIIKEVA